MARRFFTPAEANELLAEVRPLAEKLAAHRRAQAIATVRHARVARQIVGNGGGVQPARIDELEAAVEAEAAAVARCLGELEALGVLVKDLDQPLLDFPSMRAGEEVLLCWCLGEDAVRCWHGLDEGFAGRKEVDWS